MLSYRAALPAVHPVIASALCDHADLRRLQNRPAEALELYNESIAMYRQTGEGGRLGLAIALQRMGYAFQDLGQTDNAEQVLVEAIDMLRGIDNGADQLPYVLNDLGILRLSAGRARESLEVFEEALKIRQQATQGDDAMVMDLLNNIGAAWRDLQECVKAEPFFRQAVEMGHRLNGPASLSLANALSNLALCLHRLGRQDEARVLIAESEELVATITRPDEGTVQRIMGRKKEIMGE